MATPVVAISLTTAIAGCKALISYLHNRPPERENIYRSFPMNFAGGRHHNALFLREEDIKVLYLTATRLRWDHTG